MIKIISEKISNSFWKDILLAWNKLTLEIPFAHPHFFFHLNIFENELFSVNGKMLRRSEFAILWRKKLFQVGDFIDEKLVPPKLMTLTELNERHNMNLDFLSYHRIKIGMNMASNELNHKVYNEDLSDISLPRIPLVLKLGCLTNKGSRIFYKTLRMRENYRSSTVLSERLSSRHI